MKPCMEDPLAQDPTESERLARCTLCDRKCAVRTWPDGHRKSDVWIHRCKHYKGRDVTLPRDVTTCRDCGCVLIVPYWAEPPSPLDTQIAGDHYRSMKIQPAEFITANNLTFLEGCVIKRVCRHRAKNGAEDIRKAIHELQLMLELEYPQ